jgi:hypothetical protein
VLRRRLGRTSCPRSGFDSFTYDSALGGSLEAGTVWHRVMRFIEHACEAAIEHNVSNE